DPSRDRCEQISVWNRVKVLRQVCVDHVSVPLAQTSVYLSHRILGTAPRPVPVGRWLEVRLEDRLQHELGGGLHHTVSDRRDAEWPFSSASPRNRHPAHRTRTVRLVAQLLSEHCQPRLPPPPL